MQRPAEAVTASAPDAPPRVEEMMSLAFRHAPHPHIAARRSAGPPKTTDEHVGLNGRIAVVLTTVVGTMWCAYAFAVLALVVLPQAIQGGLLTLVQWISQTFIQLVMLSVIMVGQNVLARASDKRADMTYKDAEATFHESEQIQAHLQEQDQALNDLLDKVARLEAALQRA
ncbi:MAG TPA: hypothetical protein VF763_10150 [Candidatus Limnocylindrales bacterium]